MLDSESLSALVELLSLLGLAYGAFLCFRHAAAFHALMATHELSAQSNAFSLPRTDWHLMNRASQQRPESSDDAP